MRIALFHGYELTGSGSNEYTRYLAAALHDAGHAVHVLCREPDPARIATVSEAHQWDLRGRSTPLFRRGERGIVVHQLPHASVRPVFLTDKQRRGNVKSFVALSDAELREYHRVCVSAVTAVLRAHEVDVVHANHVLYQPIVAREACAATGTPYVVFPHGSAIEYTLRRDERYAAPTLQALLSARAVISGSDEIEQRILALYPAHAADLAARTRIVGVGVDTGLFSPVARDRRAAAVASLRDGGPYTGKSPELTRELGERLSVNSTLARRPTKDEAPRAERSRASGQMPHAASLEDRRSSQSVSDPAPPVTAPLERRDDLESTPHATPDRPRASFDPSIGGHRDDLESTPHTPHATPDRRASLEACVAGYRDAYDHAQPDEDLPDKLASISWTDPLLLFVGALTAGKGLQSLIAALPEIARARPGVKLAIVGSGAYREALEAFVHAIATADEGLIDLLVEAGWDLDRSEQTGPWRDVARYLADPRQRRTLLDAGADFERRVLFLGRLDHDKLRHLFPCADVAVFPSQIPEAYPLVLMEALANGVIPAVSDFSGFRDGLTTLEPLLGSRWIERMRLPVDHDGRVAGIAAGIRDILGDPERDELLPRLREIAVEHFDWSVRAEQMVAAYQAALTADHPGPAERGPKRFD